MASSGSFVSRPAEPAVFKADLEAAKLHLGLDDRKTGKIQQLFDELVKTGTPIPHLDENRAITLMRFVRARGGNVAKALKQLHKTLAFRKTLPSFLQLDAPAGVLPLPEGLPKALLEYWPDYCMDEVVRQPTPRAKDGSVLILETIGQIDSPGMVSAVMNEPTAAVKYAAWKMENMFRLMRRLSKEEGKPVHRLTIVTDTTGLNHRHLYPAGLALLKNIMRAQEDFYPDTLERAFIINCPYVFKAVWAIVSLFLDAGTLNKIRLFSGGFERTILQFVDGAELPKVLGGTSPRAMPTGGTVPPELLSGGGLGFTPLAVAARYTGSVRFAAEKGQRIEFAWQTLAKDIGFSATFVPAEAGAVAVNVAEFKRAAKDKGEFVAPSAGELVAKFDNGYSYLTGKTIFHRIRVATGSAAAEQVIIPDSAAGEVVVMDGEAEAKAEAAIKFEDE